MTKSNNSVLIAIVIAVVAVVAIVAATSGKDNVTGAATQSAQCISTNTWPQKVVLNGKTYPCTSAYPYCNFDKSKQGVGECCKNYPYSDCLAIGPTPCPPLYLQDNDGICRRNGKTCTDSDGGKNDAAKGTVVDTQTTWVGNTWTDYCSGNSATEFYCDQNDNVQLVTTGCPYGCDSATGSCLSSLCYDSDGGRNPAIKGTIYLQGTLKGTDYCFGKGRVVAGKVINENYIREYYCSNNQVTYEDIRAPCPF